MSFRINMKKKSLVVSTIIVGLIIILSSFIIYKRSNYNFTIVFSSDVHSRTDQFLGYARFSTVIKDLKKRDGKLPLVFDDGDTFSGSTEVALTEGEYIVKVLNSIPYNVLGLGNHDFVYSRPILKKIISNLSFPVISTNILNEKGEHEFIPSLIIPYKVNLFKTVNIGVISLITPTTKEKNLGDNVEGLEFSSSYKLVQDEIDKLKDRADFIVLLSHLNTEANEFSSQRESTGFYLERVLSNVKGIDLVIVGHLHLDPTHSTVYSGVPAFFAWSYLQYIGVLQVKKTMFKNWKIKEEGIKDQDKDKKDKIEEDPKIVELIHRLNTEFKDKYNKIIGSSPKEIPFLKTELRLSQTELGRWLADVIKKDRDVDLALINSGAIRAGIKKGDITENDTFLVFPFKNKGVSVELSGKEIKDILEQSYSSYPNLSPALLQVSSDVDLKLNLNKVPYHRVVSIKISKKPIDMNKTYKVMINNFLKEGGDGYSIFKDKKVVQSFGYLYEDLKNYIKNNTASSLRK